MRALPLPLLLAACIGNRAPPPPLDVPGGASVVRLDGAPAQISLPPTTLPAGTPTDATFRIAEWQPAGGRGDRVRLRAPLPFLTAHGGWRGPALDLQLVADGALVPFAPQGRAVPSWQIDGDDIVWVRSAAEAPTEVVLAAPRLAAELARLQPATAGLAPADFVVYSATIDQETRAGLLLPAPARVTWTLDLPPGAALRAATALLAVPLRGVTSDGATLRLDVLGAGGAVPVAERALTAGGAFEPWEVDLSAHAGPGVTLQLTVDPGPDAVADLAFLAHPEIVGRPGPVPPRRVLWIGLDTTRPDHLGFHGYARDTTPRLDAWARNATVFDDAVAPAPRTRPSFRAALTGRRPLDAVGAPTFLATLREAGFSTAGIVANVHLDARLGFADGADRWLHDPSARADVQVDRALAWLQDNADRDAALFLHVMDPHLLYDAPEPYLDRFAADPDPDLPPTFSRSTVLRWGREGRLDARRKAHIEARYDGEVAWTDAQLGRLLDAVEGLPGRTLVVLHSDHGEELWEHGGFEHNHTLKPEVVDALLVIRTPGQEAGRRVGDPVTLEDLAPTVLGLLGVDPPATDGVDLAPALRGEALPDRPLGVAHLMYDRERWGVRADGHTYVLHTGSGREELYDRAGDPGEHTDLAGAGVELGPWREALARAHGVDVGPGWRAEVVLGDEPVQWQLPAPALSAGVLDPEVFRVHRANLVWGEPAAVLPEEVADVELSEDGTSLRITPGSHGRGTLWVRFAAPRSPGGVVSTASGSAPVEGGPQTGLPGLPRLDVRAGTVIVPPVGEAARLAALGRIAAPDAGTQTLLRKLGYLRDGEPEDDEESAP